MAAIDVLEGARAGSGRPSATGISPPSLQGRIPALPGRYHGDRCAAADEALRRQTIWPALIGALICLLAACAHAGGAIRSDALLELYRADGETAARIRVEIADTRQSRARGLMHRVLPDDETGMLFIFPRAEHRTFWMRNTPASLDMLFADAERRIIHIARETTPMSDQSYPSRGAARYVLETRAGFTERHDIAPGDRFDYFPTPLLRHGRDEPGRAAAPHQPR